MKNDRNVEIDVLRAIAVVFVLIHHYPILFGIVSPAVYEKFEGLWSGVDLFFCISGYVISKNLLPKLQNSRGRAFWLEVFRFWVRRWYRIVPPAWFWIGMLALLNLPLVRARDPVFFGDVWAALLNYTNIHYYICSRDAAAACQHLNVYWSLSLEQQFYIALPIVYFLFRRWFVWSVLLIAFSQMLIPRAHWIGILSFVRTDAIALGVLLAMASHSAFYRSLEPASMPRYLMIIISSVLVFLLGILGVVHISKYYMGGIALISLLLVWMASYGRGYLMPAGIWRDMSVGVGARSFSIYLGHVVSFALARRIVLWIWPGAVSDSWMALCLLFVMGMLVLAILVELSYRWIELPWMRRGQVASQRIGQGLRSSHQP